MIAERFEYREQLKQRTKLFALRVVKLFQSLPKIVEYQVFGKQLLRSATSVTVNYRAVCRARSHSEYYSKINIVIEEADETMFLVGNTLGIRYYQTRIVRSFVFGKRRNSKNHGNIT